MSLINEALKRARQESRRREALAKGLPLAPPPRTLPHRTWMAAAVTALALALLVSLVTIARLTSSQSTLQPANGSGASALVASAGPEAATNSTPKPLAVEVDSREQPLPEKDLDTLPLRAEVSGPGPTEVATAESLPISPRDPGTLLDPTPVATIPPATESRPAPRSTTTTPLPRPSSEGVRLKPEPADAAAGDPQVGASSGPREFVGTAALANGDTLELAGIAWSETGPYALLDQRVVGLGEVVMGYRVTRIAPQEVELESGDDSILIRLK